MGEKGMHKKLLKSLSGIWSTWSEFLSPWSILCAEYSFRIIIVLNKQITYSTCEWVFGVNLYGDNSIPSLWRSRKHGWGWRTTSQHGPCTSLANGWWTIQETVWNWPGKLMDFRHSKTPYNLNVFMCTCIHVWERVWEGTHVPPRGPSSGHHTGKESVFQPSP